jgi:itaconate CoA-transferase
MLGLQNEREWEAFCDRVLQRPELARDPRFASNSKCTQGREALRAIIVDAFSRLSAEQLEARRRWTQVDTPAGPLPALLPPGAPDAASVRMDPLPALGRHTETILAELGCSPEQVAGLREAKAV